MKRLHVSVSVNDLDASIDFYRQIFAAEPSVLKDDYAKWMLDDPRINFAISTRVKTGVDHLGLQVEQAGELEELRGRLKNADLSLFDEGKTVCCYARSDKSWVTDPAGIAWEAYQTMEDVQLFSAAAPSNAAACCTPKTKGQPDGSEPAEKTTGCCG